MYIGLIFIKVVVGTQLKRNWMKSSNDAFYTRVRVYMLTYYITVLTFFYSFLRLIRFLASYSSIFFHLYLWKISLEMSPFLVPYYSHGKNPFRSEFFLSIKR